MKIAFLLIFLLSGCAQVSSLNLQKHEFGILPTRIIWFQVEGLDEEQLALLRFNQNAERRTSFEESLCMGNSWAYDLYNLRPAASESFLAQITGKKNIKNSCEDVSLKPIWAYLKGSDYYTGILEVGTDEESSLLKHKSCEQGEGFYKDIYFWSMKYSQAPNLQFHYGEDIPLNSQDVLFDRACSRAGCNSTIFDNVRAINSKLARAHHRYLFIVRDSSYAKAINKKKYKEARNILVDLERSYSEALKMTKNSHEVLVLLTTANSTFVQFPDQGKPWYEFEKQNRAQPHRTKLTNLVLASGARAENFCGIYEEAQLFERILSGPKQQGLEFKFINPFN
ncbi:MAG TPA: hypothetical protein VKZ84_03870 [Bacteriovoracaceae bacterium]|nr:hypothetical protein [Bacteriovoracaceae bacterium]